MPGKDHFLKRIVRVSGEEFKLVMVCFIFSSSSSGCFSGLLYADFIVGSNVIKELWTALIIRIAYWVSITLSPILQILQSVSAVLVYFFTGAT